MSRIPVFATSPPRGSDTHSVSFPSSDRASSPVPSRHSSHQSVSMSAVSGSTDRKKLSKRALGDEALRKRIENELARKRTISTTQQHSGGRRRTKPSVAKGTVAALKPSPALTVPESITVAEASQLCAAKRTDCVLVVDDEEGLSGIFTAKDLAYRVTAEGIDPHHTPVEQVMTRNPMVTRDTTSATEALQLMVQKHFRHLPVCNEEGNVVGLLDITKVFHEALDKVERSSSASEKLYSALAGVQNELGVGAANPQAAAMLSYVEALREKTALPDLTTVMDSRTLPATVGPKATVREVARLMRERRTTAVCVMEAPNPASGNNNPRIAGIFTSKDVVLRVIAAGLDASRCSVVRVMTPHPDTALPTTTVHDALKKMHVGHFLNLPVVEGDGRLVAIVDVLKLTYATLEQMNNMSAEQLGAAANDTEGGPMWGRFFDSIGHDDTESHFSGSHIPTDLHNSSFSLSQIQQSPHSEVHPNDSASVVDEDKGSVISGLPTRNGLNIPSIMGANVPAPDDGTYVFKFRTPSGNTHRFQSRHDDVEHLRDIVVGKLGQDAFFLEFKPKGPDDPIPDPLDFRLAYTDADGDTVLMTSDDDVADAVKIARNAGQDRVVLIIQGGHGWNEAGANKSAERAQEAAAAAAQEIREVERAEARAVEAILPEGAAMAPPAPVHVIPNDDVFGIPRDLVLPASIGALAVAIIAVFTISRLASD